MYIFEVSHVVAFGTYPVYVTDGVGDQRFRLTIRCLNLESEFHTFISEDAADILCSASHCEISSEVN